MELGVTRINWGGREYPTDVRLLMAAVSDLRDGWWVNAGNRCVCCGKTAEHVEDPKHAEGCSVPVIEAIRRKYLGGE